MIDAQLTAAGWHVQNRDALDLFAGLGVAVREVTMARGHGRADYLLYVDKRAVGVIEAKPVGSTLSGVEWQSARYAEGLPSDVLRRARTVDGRLPFVIEASGTETHLTNGYDPAPRARRIAAVPQPRTLARTVRAAEVDPQPTWRGKVAHLPPLDTTKLRPAQITAVDGVERSLVEQRFDRSLVQMATGAGKTFAAVTLCYRLLKHGGFRRILFLVDRNNLADQALAEFEDYRPPDDNRRFTEVYTVDKLSRAGTVDSSNVVVSTIQRVHRVLSGHTVGIEDDPGLDGFVPDAPVDAPYNPSMPPEAFDLVIVDEAHRSIYGSWRPVLEYFDAHLLGLTATPGKQTFGFFAQNLVSEYTYQQSVVDQVNVDFDLYVIRTQITQHGSRIEAGTYVPHVDRRTRVEKLVELDEDLEYTATELDRAVTSTSQIRLVLETFRDRLFTEIFPGRSVVPKTLVFCKDDAHAEEVVTLARQVFGKGNDFAAKITYQAQDPKGALQRFRTRSDLRIAATVDMVATGTDIKPLECVMFMRDVRSAQYFEQMKGRGARTIESADFRVVTPDESVKTRFVIVDAVGVTDHAFVEPPLNRQPRVSLKRLLDKAATLTLTEDETATLASRLNALRSRLTPEEETQIDTLSATSLQGVIQGLVTAIDPDAQAGLVAAAPDEAAGRAAVQDAIEDALEPLAASPTLRQRLLALRQAKDRVRDEVSVDVLLDAHGEVDLTKAGSVIESWHAYLRENRDEIAAIQLMGDARRVGYADIKALAADIALPPRSWTADVIWSAYAAVEVGRVRHGEKRTLTDLVQLLRFSLSLDEELVPYAERVRERYAGWLAQQEQAGASFSPSERWWLDRMVEVVAVSAGITVQDLRGSPFTERGGVDGAVRDLGARAGSLIETLNQELTA